METSTEPNAWVKMMKTGYCCYVRNSTPFLYAWLHDMHIKGEEHHVSMMLLLSFALTQPEVTSLWQDIRAEMGTKRMETDSATMKQIQQLWKFLTVGKLKWLHYFLDNPVSFFMGKEEHQNWQILGKWPMSSLSSVRHYFLANSISKIAGSGFKEKTSNFRFLFWLYTLLSSGWLIFICLQIYLISNFWMHDFEI